MHLTKLGFMLSSMPVKITLSILYIIPLTSTQFASYYSLNKPIFPKQVMTSKLLFNSDNMICDPGPTITSVSTAGLDLRRRKEKQHHVDVDMHKTLEHF